ncbi:hypothetical protein ACMBCN_02370 [Candidatus Liberibacter asiaticus]|nr:hypothetical protein [Candidatus Liberibacter asiaticus]
MLETLLQQCCSKAPFSSSSSSSIYIYQNSIPVIMNDLQNKSNHFRQHTSSLS